MAADRALLLLGTSVIVLWLLQMDYFGVRPWRAVWAVGVGVFGILFVAVAARIVGIVGVSSQPVSGMTLVTLLGVASVFVAAGWTGPEAQAAVLTELIDGVMKSLPERDRQIVSMSLEGKDAAQIGEVIGRAERTVRRTLDHFRARLEAAVKEPETLFQRPTGG